MAQGIVFDNVSFEYVKDEPVIRNVSLRIDEGEFVAVVGHNGSGKSTLAKLMNAILVPNSGSVSVFGLNTSDESRLNEIRRSAGMVFQNPDNQIVATSVEEDTAFAPENLGVAPDEIRRRVDEALAQVDMLPYAQHQPHKLSGGQKQRVAIAGIIAMQPRCIILDEPTAMLDPKGRREVLATVQKLNSEGITVVLVTHYMDEAAQAKRVLVMNYGQIVRDATPREVFSDYEAIKSWGLDLPASTLLALRLSQAGLPMGQTVLTPDECADRIAEILGGAQCR